jgi:site-specific recombinase XerD
MILYFSEEVAIALKAYIEEKAGDPKIPQGENAFFLSLQYKRMTVRAVEMLVKKYARIVTPLKKITPHKLRSTYGTMLYRETGDIYIVADVLGHKDVNTTKKHYAAISEDSRKKVAGKVKLRKDEDDQ